MKNITLYFRIISLLIIFSSLSGCIAVVAAIGGATAGGAIIYDQRTYQTMLQDRYSEQIAQNRINLDPALKNHSHISAIVFNHVLLLVGQAPTQELSDRAYQLASTVEHISRSYNQITIGNSTSFAQRSKDSWVTTKVKSALLAEKGLQSNQFKVVTENGVVYLMGLTTQEQASIASNVARRITGVQKVVTLLQYN